MPRNVDLEKFLRSQGLFVIEGYRFFNSISGGSSFSAIYKNGNDKVFAKFFFYTPNQMLLNSAKREINNIKYASEIPMSAAPKFICEFEANSGAVFGYLMEYVEGYSFEDILNSAAGFSDLCQIAFRIGWAACHSLKGAVTHRDLHPGNFIFTEKVSDWKMGYFENEPAVRLIDFGASVSAYHAMGDGIGHADVLKRFDGAITCVAPEYFRRGFNFLESMNYDSWALGLLFCRVFTKNIPFEISTLGSYVEDIYNGRLQGVINLYCDREIDNFFVNWLIKRMLIVDGGKRLPAWLATEFVGQLWRMDSSLLEKNSIDKLSRYVLIEGCDPEYHLPPHERSNSPY